jgi:hypothetical protein
MLRQACSLNASLLTRLVLLFREEAFRSVFKLLNGFLVISTSHTYIVEDTLLQRMFKKCSALHRDTGFSDFVHRPDSKLLKTQRFGNWMFPSSGEGRRLEASSF